ncbi:MAG TPA: polysaccharide deacetylase family protein [Bryobacteraceae bacterium]|nr:polysaccharide deacetylase family protein [Bryobacteraceae bacterium]
MSRLLHAAAASAFHHAGGLAAVRWFHRGSLRILMYHRFADRTALASQCAHIRAHYQPVSMRAVSQWLHSGRSLPPYAVAVTVDDGYADFQDAGYPVFAEYGIPVTVFLVTDFIDRKLWLWFDRVVYAFRHGQVAAASIEMPDGSVLRFKLESDTSRREAGQHLANLAVSLGPGERRELVESLPRLLKTDMPEQPPPEYRPLSWDEVRLLAASGVEFGAHTRTHPILSALTDAEELREEIAGSKARIEAELDRPVLHFCYPNGKMPDIGREAIDAVRAAGMQTAVTAEPGLNEAHQDAFLLNRIGPDPSHPEMYFARRLAGI